MNRRFLVLALLILSASNIFAQGKFYIEGLGRTIVTNNKLFGPALEGDTKTPNHGVGGYLLFDLGNNLSVSNDFHVNAILRARSPYGAFWGVGTQLLIRQFQISGKIKKSIEFQIGDINVGAGMTEYTVNNFATEYHTFESDLFRIRRGIVEYENFIFGNQWRLQGGQARATYNLNKFGKALDLYAFAVRTNMTNDVSIPDRVLAGARANLIKNDNFQIGGNYVGLLDIEMNNSIYNYKNNVLTGNTTINLLKKDALGLKLIGEGGFSDYDYSKDSSNISVSFNDYIFDVGAILAVNKKISLTGTYRDVGPNFTSPSAQTRRINVLQTPALFPTLFNNTVSRNQTLFDRFTDEGCYNRYISPLLLPYLPQYNNITPYGRATPNRRGLNAKIESDTSVKVIKAEVIVDVLSEIKGEGIVDKRQFFGVRGGAVLRINEIINSKRLYSLNFGARYERTKRDGLLPINLNSNLLDAGVAAEILSKFDVLLGAKLLFANGNEYINVRDNFNQITAIDEVKIDISEMIYSAGIRIRFRENSIFNVAYNTNRFRNNATANLKYNIDQLFVNFTLRF